MGVVFGTERHRPTDSPFRLVLNAVLTSLFAALSLVASGAAQGAVINAASPSLTDVTAAIHSAADGDTVTIPKGTAPWTSTLKISKGITLMGQTTTDPVHKTANDQTIISVNTGTNGNTPLIVLETALGKSYRLSGITFRTGQTQIVNSNGMLQLSGKSHAVRVDHCHFDDLAYENNNIAMYSVIFGVIDHNLFDFRSPNNRAQSIYVNMDAWGEHSYGDGSWSEPAYYGSEKFLFIEDNCINNTTSNTYAGVIDGWRGGRYVCRYNHLYNAVVTNHGTEIGRERGFRCMEVYNNDFHWTVSTSVGGTRSGGQLWHDNKHDGAVPDRGPTMGQYRVFQRFEVWGGASGDNPWDYNVTDANETHVEGHSPYLFDSGTAGSGSNQNAIVDTTKHWTTDRWRGFTAKRLSDDQVALIASNTSNTLQVLYNPGYGGGATWAPNDRYQIHKVLIALDQACRGAGDLITGGFSDPINSKTGTRAWPHQALEPCYSWNDIYTPTGAHVDLALATGAFAVLREGRDFYNNTPMPGYRPYTYPHPLTIALPPSQPSSGSHPYGKKTSERKGKKISGWGRARKSPENEMAQPDQTGD